MEIEKKLSPYLFFDIETCRKTNFFHDLTEREQFNFLYKNRSRIFNLSKLALDEHKAIEIYANMTDGDSEKQKQELYESYGSFYPEFSRVICCGLGAYTPNGEERTNIISITNSENEKEVLFKISEIFTKAEKSGKILAGWNIKNFDIPFLVKRMIINEVNIPNNLRMYDKKPWDIKLLELTEIWTSSKFGDYTTLDSISCALGLDSSKNGLVNNMNVAEYFYSLEDKTNIDEYCLLDVKVTMEVAKKITPYVLF